jgi:glycogen debranching enzyme
LCAARRGEASHGAPLAEEITFHLADALVVKRGNLFMVTPRDGDLPADPGGFGLWYRDCRHLSAHLLLLDGEPPTLLQASDALGTRAVHELSGARRPVSLRVDRVLDEEPGVLVEGIVLRSHAPDGMRVSLELTLGADFEPMLAVRGLVERPSPPPVESAFDGRTLSWSTMGRDGVVRTTTVETSEPPASEGGGVLRFEIDLPGRGERRIEMRIAAGERADGAGDTGPNGETPPLGGAARRPRTEQSRVRSDDELFDRVLSRSLLDLDMLRSELDGRSYFAAGVPWFATLFGRDSLIAAMQALAFDPDVAADTLRLLGDRMGRMYSDEHDEDPGKVLHELRVGEPAALGETPFARYYGSADATPLWLCLLADHADWSGSLELFGELRPQVEAALEWIAGPGDRDGDGLVEYQCRSRHGLRNQGWKDSPDGVPDAGGRPLEPPVALIEVQGYVVRALRGIARLFELDGDPSRSEALRTRAAEVDAALARFWAFDPGGYAIGLDADKRPGTRLSSNQGHLLWAGAVPADRARSLRELLMAEHMFSGWGVRTLSDRNPAFNPLGYHTGSVWPHDTAMIARGLRRYGFDEDFLRIFDALLEAASRFDDYRLPELFGGFARRPGEDPVPYPVACRPQAWAAGSIPHLLAAGLGLEPDALHGRLRVVRPLLPSWVGWLSLEGMRVGDAEVDLRFERAGRQVVLADARTHGNLQLVLETE